MTMSKKALRSYGVHVQLGLTEISSAQSQIDLLLDLDESTPEFRQVMETAIHDKIRRGILALKLALARAGEPEA